MLKRRNVLGTRVLLCVLVIICALSASAGILIYNALVSDTVRNALVNQTRSVINEEINSVVSEYVSKHPELRECCFTTVTDSSGVKSFEADASLLRTAEENITKDLKARLKDNEVISVKIPSGTLTEISYFSGRGLPLKIRSYVSYGIRTELSTELDGTGINQSVYRATLKVSIDADLLFSGKEEHISLETEATLAEKIIIGDVPLAGR